ncbi:MAG TPA: hypothetical protein VGV59_09385 [Pyrinomonadaceae bacterium]|nr:hypothetical protein [Pyrinomonadaceae bacterium]
MHYTGSDQTICATYVREPDIHARLYWLTCELESEEAMRRLSREERERTEVRLMRRPLSCAEAYGRFGLLLGLLPPASIFYLILSNFKPGRESSWMVMLAFAMLAACAVCGRLFGMKLGELLGRFERRAWWWMLCVPSLVGAWWGILTGAFGGSLFFGVGAVGGVVCAVPVGTAAFTFFVPLHRLLARGGMIDARHFWPLATCAAATISAAILGLRF